MTSEAEQAVVRHAVQRGYLTEDQVHEALAQAQSQGTPLLHLVGEKLSPEHLHELRAVYAAHSPAPGLSAQATRIRKTTGPFGRELTEIPERIGEYTIVREIARGGMGAVFVAHHPKLDRKVAIKILLGNAHPMSVRRFQIEARATARLRHPNIVAIHEVGSANGVEYLVMDLIEGESLDALVERSGPLAPQRAAQIMEKVARAIYVAHTEAILHRDLKPANVLLDTSGEPLVTDFGIAKVTDSESKSLTKTGAIMGSPAYMSPEQACGRSDQIDRRTDVWALGATLYELLTGRVPFTAESSVRLIYKIAQQPPPPMRAARKGIPGELELICLKCLEKRPEDRYGSALALADDLKAFLEDQPISVRRPTLVRRLRQFSRRRPLAAALGLVVGALVVLAGSLGLSAWKAQRKERAAGAESRALADYEAARRKGWPETETGAAEAALLATTLLDPTLPRSWRALARISLEHGDPELARERLASARELAPLDAEGRYVQGCLLEDAGDSAAAFVEFDSARRAGFAGEALALRLARTRAEVYDARGWSTSAEADRWAALRLAPAAPAPLVGIVESRLRADDVEGLSVLWGEIHDRLGEPGAPVLQAVLRSHGDALLNTIRDSKAPPHERVRAALASALVARPSHIDALEGASSSQAEPPLLRAAAAATLLHIRSSSGAPGPFAAWAAEAATSRGPLSALHALTLVEHARALRPSDEPALAALASSPSPALRASLALALALSATRDGGLARDVVRARLTELSADATPLVSARATRALGALAILKGGGESTDSQQIALASRLWESPGLALDLRAGAGYPEALERSLKAAPAPETYRLWARLLVARWEFKAALLAVETALRSAPQHLGLLALRQQLESHAGMPESAWSEVADADPLDVSRARARVAFTQRHGAVALEAGAGMIRVVIGFDSSRPPDEIASGTARALDVDLSRVVAGAQGLQTETGGALNVRSVFAFSTWRSIAMRGSPGPTGVAELGLYCGRRRSASAGLRLELGRARTTLRLESERELASFDVPNPNADPLELTLGRGALEVYAGGVHLGRASVPARSLPSAGTASVTLPGGTLRGLELVGRWDPDGPPRSPPPTPAEWTAFYEGLLPVEPAERITFAAPLTPTELPTSFQLVRTGAQLPGLRAAGQWAGRLEEARIMTLCGAGETFEIRGWVPESGYPAHQFGFGLLNRDRGGDRVVFGIEGGATTRHQVWLATQRGFEPEQQASGHYMTSKDPLVLSLARRGDYVLARYAATPAGPWTRLPPLYFPFEGAVDACLFARILDDREPVAGQGGGVLGEFEGLELREPGPP